MRVFGREKFQRKKFAETANSARGRINQGFLPRNFLRFCHEVTVLKGIIIKRFSLKAIDYRTSCLCKAASILTFLCDTTQRRSVLLLKTLYFLLKESGVRSKVAIFFTGFPILLAEKNCNFALTIPDSTMAHVCKDVSLFLY